MSRKWTELVSSFEAQAEDGQSFTIHYYVDKLETRSGTSVVDGLKRLRTADGNTVNRVSQGVYEIVQLGNLKVTSVCPDAP